MKSTTLCFRKKTRSNSRFVFISIWAFVVAIKSIYQVEEIEAVLNKLSRVSQQSQGLPIDYEDDAFGKSHRSASPRSGSEWSRHDDPTRRERMEARRGENRSELDSRGSWNSMDETHHLDATVQPYNSRSPSRSDRYDDPSRDSYNRPAPHSLDGSYEDEPRRSRSATPSDALSVR
jgi:hypothetical protein